VRTLPPERRERNDPRQYDDLVDEWWKDRGGFAMLHWIARARAQRVPTGSGLLLDLACGGGLMAPHVEAKGYAHVGLDLSFPSLKIARDHGLVPVRGDVLRLPFRDEVAEVVVAGEVLEHVTDLEAAVSEACRVLKPGGTLVVDTIANTWFGRFTSITVGEHIPSGPPKHLHDPALYVDRKRLVALAREHGVDLQLVGLRPSVLDFTAWLAHRREEVRMLPTRSTAGLFQGWGTKRGGER